MHALKRFPFTVLFMALLLATCEDETENKSLQPYMVQNDGKTWIFDPNFSNEFDAGLDAQKWITAFDGWDGYAPGWYSDQNVEVKGGELVITMRKERLPEMPADREYTTGVLRSRELVKYGFFEVRAQCMNSAGSSTFFLSECNEEQWSEIDIFEIGGKAIEHEQIVHTCLHEFYNPNNIIAPCSIHEEIHYAYGYDHKINWRPADDYHVYGLDWSRDSIKWYVDGRMIRGVQNIRWHQAYKISIESGIMESWFGLPKDEDLPSEYKVDYLRVFRRE